MAIGIKVSPHPGETAFSHHDLDGSATAEDIVGLGDPGITPFRIGEEMSQALVDAYEQG